ncbi:MAG: universal stress protein [Chloroflexota bacterium]|nr:universal stress protein [Chloroflexota bacterium]
MKVLFATDGAPEDQQARALMASVRWPRGSELELFGVSRPTRIGAEGHDEYFAHELGVLASSVTGSEHVVTWHCAVGQPAESIVERARAIGADLIVVGSRNRGPLASMLGSVSAAVVDHAPCPVLVARSAQIDRVVIADDGSVGAAAAIAFFDRSAIFGDAPLHVVSVVDRGEPLSDSDFGGLSSVDQRHYSEHVDQERRQARLQLVNSLDALQPRTHTVESSTPFGDAATEILVAAHDFAADLIVMGSRGQTRARPLLRRQRRPAGVAARDVLRAHRPRVRGDRPRSCARAARSARTEQRDRVMRRRSPRQQGAACPRSVTTGDPRGDRREVGQVRTRDPNAVFPRLASC